MLSKNVDIHFLVFSQGQIKKIQKEGVKKLQ